MPRFQFDYFTQMNGMQAEDIGDFLNFIHFINSSLRQVIKVAIQNLSELYHDLSLRETYTSGISAINFRFILLIAKV